MNGVRIVALQGDITGQDTEAIVNAANTGMRGGGGVDGAIHRRAGTRLLEELRRVAPSGAKTGEVVVTPGFELAARQILHVAGPIWRGGHEGEDAQLAACYRNALDTAGELGLRSIAFPSISTGAYGYPVDRAAPIALGEVLRNAAGLEEVRFVLYDRRTEAVYESLMAKFDEIHAPGVLSDLSEVGAGKNEGAGI